MPGALPLGPGSASWPALALIGWSVPSATFIPVGPRTLEAILSVARWYSARALAAAGAFVPPRTPTFLVAVAWAAVAISATLLARSLVGTALAAVEATTIFSSAAVARAILVPRTVSAVSVTRSVVVPRSILVARAVLAATAARSIAVARPAAALAAVEPRTFFAPAVARPVLAIALGRTLEGPVAPTLAAVLSPGAAIAAFERPIAEVSILRPVAALAVAASPLTLTVERPALAVGALALRPAARTV